MYFIMIANNQYTRIWFSQIIVVHLFTIIILLMLPYRKEQWYFDLQYEQLMNSVYSGCCLQFVTIEAIIAGVLDEFTQLRKRKRLVTFVTCFILFLLSIICNTEVCCFFCNNYKFNFWMTLLIVVFQIVVLFLHSSHICYTFKRKLHPKCYDKNHYTL